MIFSKSPGDTHCQIFKGYLLIKSEKRLPLPIVRWNIFSKSPDFTMMSLLVLIKLVSNETDYQVVLFLESIDFTMMTLLVLVK